jgi:PAS domain S-box-containing protein
MGVKKPTYEELEQMVEKLKKESHVRTQTEKTMRESEKLYRFLTENTSDVITRHLPDSTYLYISPACRTLFGYTPEELLGTKAFALIHPEDVERVITISQEVVKTGELRREQYRHLKKDGQYIWVETVGKVIKNELTGNIEDIICVVRDITERKRIEEILKASEEKYRTLAENSTDAIVMADKERRIVSCNQAFHKLFGYDKDEVEGKSAKIFHPSDESFNAYGELVYPIVNKTGFFRTEWDFMRKDGTVLPVELVTSAIKSSDGFITGFVVVIRDITERKQAEEESKKYQTLFETSNDAIMMMNEDRFVDGNQATLDLFGFTSKADFITKSPVDLSPPTQADGTDSLTTQKQHLARTFETGTDFFEWVHKKADGTLFPAEVKLSRLPLGEGVVLQALVRDITERRRAEEEREKLILELRTSLEKVKTLSGLLPICASCKKIRDDKGYWNQIESYIRDHSEAEFSHGICPECMKKLYPDFEIIE